MMSNVTPLPVRQIDRLDYIQNIGRFETVREPTAMALRPLSLITAVPQTFK